MHILAIIFSAACFLSFLLNILLYPWHIRFENIPGLSILSWLTVASFALGLNAIAFDAQSLLVVPFYCDVVTKILIGAQMGVAVSMMCLLFQFGDWLCRPEYRDLKQKRLEHRSTTIALLCFVAPNVYMGLHVAAQGHRFDIVEDFGCIPATETSALSFIFIWVLPMIPCVVTSVYSFLILRYLMCYNRLTPARQTTWEKLNSDLAFTKAPYGIFRIIRLGTVACLLVLWIFLTPILPLIIFINSHFVGFTKPQLGRIDVFQSFASASPTASAMLLVPWSIPVYSILFFIANIDKDVLESFPFLFSKHVLDRSPMNPDPSPGVDLTTLTPIPVRKRIHRRVIRASRMYDAPVTDEEFDIEIPHPLHSQCYNPELTHYVNPPPMPEGIVSRALKDKALLEALSLPVHAHSNTNPESEPKNRQRPAPKASVPEDINASLFPERPEPVHHYSRTGPTPTPAQEQEKGKYSKKTHIRARRQSQELAKALSEHVESKHNFPMHDIPESPCSPQSEKGSAMVEIRSPIKSMYAEVVVDGIVVSEPFQPEFKFGANIV